MSTAAIAALLPLRASPPHRGIEAPAARAEGDDGEHAADDRNVIEEDDALEARLGRRRQPIGVEDEPERNRVGGQDQRRSAREQAGH
jgi:hypothetical protein